MKNFKSKTWAVAAIIMVLAVSLIGLSAISLHRFYSYQIFHYDFGYFARVIYQLSRFKLPVINHVYYGRILFLADHFSPSLALLAPLFWLSQDPRILLIEQAAAIVSSAVILVLISKKLKLYWFEQLVVFASFLAFAGTLGPLISDWHPEPTAALLLLLIIYLVKFTNQTWTTVAISIIFLGFKESNGVILSLVSLGLLVLDKKRVKLLASLSVLGLVWFLGVTRLLIPALGSSYHYSPQLPSSLNDLTLTLSHPDKWKVVKLSLFSFGLIPLIAPGWLLLALLELATRYLPMSSVFQNFSFGMHYQAFFSVLLTLSAIYGLKRTARILSSKIKRQALVKAVRLGIALWLLLASAYTARRLTQSPINMALNPKLYQELHFRDKRLGVVRADIPRASSLMAPNNYLPHFFNQEDEIYLLEQDYDKYAPNYILIDLSLDQNQNNFFGPNGGVNLEFVSNIYNQLEADERYRMINEEGELYLFKMEQP